MNRTDERSPEFAVEQPAADTFRTVVVRVLFTRAVSRWVREARSFFVVNEEEREDGLLLTLQVRHEREVLQWLLSWGAAAHVLEPVTLREMVVVEARRMQQLYVDSALLP